MKLNLDFYKEKQENLTPIEEEIIEIINNENDYQEIIKNEERVEVIQALSDLRKNIISWYPFKENCTILQLNSNFGEITSELCEKANKVVSIESSKLKSQALMKRCKTYENLEIIVGNIEDIKFENKFDYIIMLGTLEKKQEEYEKILEKVKSLLSENGTILLTFDNKLGLKYLTKTDDTWITTTNVENKKFINIKDIYSKLEELGFKNIKNYYPMPDDKFTNVIYTDEKPISKNDISRNIVYNKESTITLCDENNVYREILDANKDMIKYFMNSYLLEVKIQDEKNDIKFVSFSNMRKPEYRIKTIMKDGYVYKYPVNEQSINHIKQVKENIDIIRKSGLKTLDDYNQNVIISKFSSEKTLDEIIINLLKENKKEEAINLILEFKNEIMQKLEKGTKENNVFKRYDISCNQEQLEEMYFIKDGLWDLTFQNCFYINNEFYFYDQEWREENLPIDFILYRAIKYFVRLKKYINDEEIYQILKIDKSKIQIFEQLDDKIQEKIRNSVLWKLNNQGKTIRDIKIELLTANHKINLLSMEKKNEVEKLNKELQDIYNSRSWKLVQKLRKIKGNNKSN